MKMGFSFLAAAAAAFSVSCASSSTGRSVAGEKATRGAVGGDLIELEAPVAYAPRLSQEMQSALVILNPATRECLKQTLITRPLKFGLDIEGHLNFEGQVEKATVTSNWPDLNICIRQALGSVRMGRGSLGPFKMRIEAPLAGQTKSKTFSIDISPPIKKFQ